MSVNNIFSLDNRSDSSYKPTDELRLKVEEFHKISDVKDKLQFYNDKICSLSYSFYHGEIYEFGHYEYYWRGLGRIIFKALPNEIFYNDYLSVRSNEIARLQKLIDEQTTKVAKLKILFEKRAGQVFINSETVRVRTNEYNTFLLNGAGTVPTDLKKYDIDLSYLETSKEKKEYNEYLYHFYTKIFRKELVQPFINIYEYNGFNYELAIEEFKIQLTNSLDFHKTLNNEIRRIEVFFPVNDFNNIIYYYYEDAQPHKWRCALFNGFINGLQYDFERVKLEPQQIKDLIHIEQVFNYYKHLLEFKNKNNTSTPLLFEPSIPPTSNKSNETEIADNFELNNDFLEYLRLEVTTVDWNFDHVQPKSIVPQKLTHNYLLNNFNIDYDILRFYCLNTEKLLTEIEFKEKFKNYAGRKETALYPYSNVIYGAFYSRVDLYLKLKNVVSTSMPYKVKGKIVKYFTDLIPYFKEYREGFENGFNKFEDEEIKPFLTMFSDKQDYINKVFEFVTKNKFLSFGWANYAHGFTTTVPTSEIINAFKDGQEQGFFYRAWSIIFSNHTLFAPLFQRHLNVEVKESPDLTKKLTTITEIKKYKAKHYLLAYLFECNANGESYPIGNKKELERIGNERLGAGKGNRFYKVFNEIVNKDLNAENDLFEIGGENWRKAVIELSKTPELVENYLQSKEL